MRETRTQSRGDGGIFRQAGILGFAGGDYFSLGLIARYKMRLPNEEPLTQESSSPTRKVAISAHDSPLSEPPRKGSQLRNGPSYSTLDGLEMAAFLH